MLSKSTNVSKIVEEIQRSLFRDGCDVILVTPDANEPTNLKHPNLIEYSDLSNTLKREKISRYQNLKYIEAYVHVILHENHKND